MLIQADARNKPWLTELSRIRELLEQNQHEEARDAALKLRAACAAEGVRSSNLEWHVAIAADNLGDFEMAYQSIREAVRLDPLAVPAWQSFRIIVDRMRDQLTDQRRAADDPSTPRLYALLTQAGEATAPCHIAMARHLDAAGKKHEALRLLSAVTLLHPGEAEGWTSLAGLARSLGDEACARNAEAEAAALGAGAGVPFTIPGPAMA